MRSLYSTMRSLSDSIAFNKGSSAACSSGLKPSAFVRTRCSSCIWPASSTTQYQLLRSPRSNPRVSFCCEIFLLCAAALMLIFFIAGLLFICASSTSITWELTASRPETGLLIPSDFVNQRELKFTTVHFAVCQNREPLRDAYLCTAMVCPRRKSHV